jgi:hypothetical protein
MQHMGNATDNHWRVPGAEQRSETYRGRVLNQIKRALVTTRGVGGDSRQRGGFDPYDSQLGATTSDVWGQRRRA